MGVTEANAASWVLNFFTRPADAPPMTQPQIARVEEGALILAASIRQRLLAGPRDEEIREGLDRFFAANGGAS